MENYTKEQLSNLTDEQLFDLRAELLKGLDDDLASGSVEANTLLAADSLEEQLQGRLFEEDNGFFDFSSQQDENSLKAVMADLRVNFSREKLAFACEIITALNRKAPVETALETEPAKMEMSHLPIASNDNKELIEQEIPEEVTRQTTEPKVHKQATCASTARPAKPNATPPSGWTSPGNAPHPNQKYTLSSSKKTAKGAQSKVGFWERNFAAVGRRIDRFLGKIFH